MATDPQPTQSPQEPVENRSRMLSGRSKSAQHANESEAALQRWFRTLRQRAALMASQAVVRAAVVFGFVWCCYLVGWWAPSKSFLGYAPLLVIPALGVSLFLYGRQIQLEAQLHRWIMLLPAGFLVATLSHFASWWVLLLLFLAFAAVSFLFHLLLFQKKRNDVKSALIDTLWNLGVILIFLSQLFLPRQLFGALLAFLPVVLLVVFYNFILERDRLLRAKALAIGEPAGWVKKANLLIPSSAYLLLLLPALLFAEAMIFHASFQLTHDTKQMSCAASQTKNPRIAPKLRNWLLYTITTRMKAKHCKDRAIDNPLSEEVSYWEFGRGYSLTASMIRAFLLFFYAKRLLLILLMLMDSTSGIRVHRIGVLRGLPGADSRLEEHREVIQRTLDSFPRTWATFLLRGIQGKHGLLDPVGGALRQIDWLHGEFLPRYIKQLKHRDVPNEPDWSRLVREEQIKLLGKMQDRTWVLEAFIDLVSPAHSTTFRGRASHLLDDTWLGSMVSFYFQPPEPEVKARIIEEMALIIERAVRIEKGTSTFQDVATEQLTHEQIWTLRDRALLVLKDLVAADEACIRFAAAKAIDAIADLPRPIRSDDMEIWKPLTDQLGERVEDFARQYPDLEELPAANQRPSTIELDLDLLADHEVEHLEEEGADAKAETLPDPFASYLKVEPLEELRKLTSALGRVGIRESVQWLEALWEDRSISPLQVLYALGLGEQANGRADSGYDLAQRRLMNVCQSDENQENKRVALKSLARIAFPQPVAASFEKFVQLRRQLHQQHRDLRQHLHQLQQIEDHGRSEQGLTVLQREQLRLAYIAFREDTAQHEALALQTLEPLHDTFWSILHYNAVVLLAAYAEGEGFQPNPEFADFLETLSLEDPQGWNEFLIHLPELDDPTSWVAPFHKYLNYVAGNEEGHAKTGGQSIHIQRFLDLRTLSVTNDKQREDVARWKELFELVDRYEKFLLEVLMPFVSCLRVRPVLLTRLADEEQESWWRITFAGLQPWLQPLSEAPAHARSDELTLAYEQYTPLSLQPMLEITWEQPLHAEALIHGGVPPLAMWGFSLTRSSELVLRKLGETVEGRGYWRALERPGDLALWNHMLEQLSARQQSRPLTEIDVHYIGARCLASYQEVFTRSRLREQDPLMIRREMATKLDNFFEHNRHTDGNTPSVFLLAGEAGMGHTTLLLQHAREQITDITQSEENEALTRLVLLADVGLFEPDDSLAEWFYRELHISLTPTQEEISQHPGADAFLPLLQRLEELFADDIDLCIYIDGYHEHPRGYELFAQTLQLAELTHASYPWCRMVLSLRQSYLEQHLEQAALGPYCVEGKFAPPEKLFYREQGGLHGMLMKLPPFLDESTPDSPKGRSELERVFSRYSDFTDTSGQPRYRPLQQIDQLEPFGMTRTLLARPSLLPVIMKTYHQRALPDDLYVLRLFSTYLQQFSKPEQAFLAQLAKRMLFGSADAIGGPEEWDANPMLRENQVLDDPTLAEFIEPFKYGTRIYDGLRARGILIRQWRLAPDKEGKLIQQRHVTFTSHMLQEYLLLKELMRLAPQWLPPKQKATPEQEEAAVSWLLSLTRKSDSFRPLEGTLVLLLLHLLEKHRYALVAQFNDRTTQSHTHHLHLLFGALIHLDPRTLTRPGGPFDVILSDLSSNDLELLQKLSRYYKHRSLYQEVDALFGLVLDRPQFSGQLKTFPQHMTDLLLERADNKRQILAQQSGGRLNESTYQEGRSNYEQALARVEQTQDQDQQARVLRYLAQYEMDTNHTQEAHQTLSQAWALTQKNEPPETLVRQLNRAWIKHLQSVLLRREAEKGEEKELLAEKLKQALPFGGEALHFARECPESERLVLLAQIYDNLGRIAHQLSSQSEAEKEEQLEQAISYFEGSIRAKRALHDYLGMAISYSGLGAVYIDLAKNQPTDEGLPNSDNWKKAEQQLRRALRLNQEKLHSDFGMALGHQALAELYLLHPEHHADGLSELVEALSAYARLHNTAGCQTVIQKLVQEIAKLPLQEMHRFLKQLVAELQRVQDLSGWLLETLWDEFASVFGNRVPKVLRDWFAKMMQS